MDEKLFFSAEEVLEWRKRQLSLGGEPADLDWLIDIGGGLGWDAIQRLKVFKTGIYLFNASLEDLSCVWLNHLKDQIPLQYLLGKCPWNDFQLEVDSSVLIPRQETEMLLELALRKASDLQPGVWADLGTGSGALAIGLARDLEDWSGHAVDISKPSLLIAKKNLARLAPKANVQFHLGDWWEPLRPWWGTLDLVVSNPPYIPFSVLKELNPIIRDHEPHLALDGGLDGMDPSRKLVKGALKALSPKGLLMFEHHHDQSEKALKLFRECGFEEVDFYNDIEGIRRFAIGRLP